jgi:hypothetical protein
VALLRDALAAAGLELYLAPYGVLPTDYECGVIEVGPCCAAPAPGASLRNALVPVWSSRADATSAWRAHRCVRRAALCPCCHWLCGLTLQRRCNNTDGSARCRNPCSFLTLLYPKLP